VRPGAVGTWRLRFVWNQSFLHLSGTTPGFRLDPRLYGVGV
jgi:hypothetical protein